MSNTEGLIKFTARATAGTVPWGSDAEALDHARTQLHDLGLIGIDPNGVGFGNISLRLPDKNAFLITGSGTGKRRVLGPDGYCLVTSWQPETNEVRYCGPLKPSSESLSHGAVYTACADTRCVIHIHNRPLHQHMLDHGFLRTPQSAAFGTAELAAAINRLVQQNSTPDGILVTPGHPDGVLAYGATIDNALRTLFTARKQLQG